MDGKSKETLNNTYDYVDSKVSSIVYDVNSYTDKTVNTAFETSLSDAKSYVDDKYNQLSDKVNKNLIRLMQVFLVQWRCQVFLKNSDMKNRLGWR